jgi:hypothetical protein
VVRIKTTKTQIRVDAGVAGAARYADLVEKNNRAAAFFLWTNGPNG